MEIKIAGLTLANVSDGSLEERFQALLCEVTEINANHLEYAGNEVVSTIKLEVEVRYRPARGGEPSSTMIVSGAELKRPKRMKTAQHAYARDGSFFVEEKPAEQVEAFPKSEGRGGIVRPLNAGSEG